MNELIVQSILCLVFSVIGVMFIQLLSQKISHAQDSVPETTQASYNISLVLFTMLFSAIIATLATKVNYSFFYIHFIIIFESILVLDWPIQLSLMGVNDFKLANQRQPSKNQLYTAKYLRLFLVTIILMLSILFYYPGEGKDSLSKLSSLLLTPLFYTVVLNACGVWLYKLILSEQSVRNQFLKESFTFTSEGIKAILITAIIVALCFWWF